MPDSLVAPAYRWCPPYTKTFGPEVVDLAASFGLMLDGNQALVLDDMFSVRPGTADEWNVVEDATVCNRQNLKTVTLEAAAVAKLALFGDDLVVWTAHEYPTSVEAFRAIKPWFTDFDHMSRLVKQVYDGKGDESIELMTGARLIFRARTKHGGRGISGDTVILDEAQKLTPANMGALVPTISARQRSHLLYGGTAGDMAAAIFRRIRNRGRAGGQPRMGYREWCAPREDCEQPDCRHIDQAGCALDRMDLIQAANPSLGIPGRLRQEVILTERQTLPPAEFMRERMGWWEDPPEGSAIVDLAAWHALADPAAELLDPVTFSIEIPLDRARAFIGTAGPSSTGRPQVEIAQTEPGTEWVLPWLQRNGVRRVVLDAGNEAASLLPALEQAHIDVHKVNGAERAQACGAMYDAIVQQQLTHLGDGEITSALAGAAWKQVGDGARVFSRRQSSSDISALYAVTLALHGHTSSRTGPSAYEDHDLVVI